MQALTWQVGGREIPFRLGHDCADAIAQELATFEADVLFVVTDATVWHLHGDRYRKALCRIANTSVIILAGGEPGKSLANVEVLLQQAVAGGATRRSVLVALGGGVIGNLTGLAAALLFRGVRFVHLPTTLLAMHDSVTSLKQGVNCGGAKNIVGTFYSPAAIVVDLTCLETLPPSHLLAGMAELIKNALIRDGDYADLFSYHLHASRAEAGEPCQWEKLIQLGVTAKSRLMRDDPLERGRAIVFEYGHTIGHALELTYGETLNHGDAVAWGMHCAAWVACEMGYMTCEGQRRHDEFLGMLGRLPCPTGPLSVEKVRWRVSLDNKRGYLPGDNLQQSAMVLLHEPGRAVNAGSEHPLVLVPGFAIDHALEQLHRLWET